MDIEEKEYILDKKIEQILEVAENVHRMAEIEADEILHNAKKRAAALKGDAAIDEISKEKSINEIQEKTEGTADLKEKDR